jgi:hypothetical protein
VRRNRLLKLVLGSSADSGATPTLGKTVKHLTLEAGATRFSSRVPANAKKGKQKAEVRTRRRGHHERDGDRDLASGRDARPPSRRLCP